LCAAYLRFAKERYFKDGRATDELAGIKMVLRFLRDYDGSTDAVKFGPLSLKALRQRMIEADHSRGYINQNVRRIKRIFKWAVSEELVPETVFQVIAAIGFVRHGHVAR
jgi:hypothetical protein